MAPVLVGNVVPPSVKVPLKLEFTKVLFVKVSVPAKVAKVPEVGKLIDVLPTVIIVVEKFPEVTKSPPKVMVLLPLSTPVPPKVGDKIPEMAVLPSKEYPKIV